MTDAMVRLEGVKFRWRAGLPLVLDIPAFDVAKGERVFVKGPSGSGKTTLLNLLGGVVAPESGTLSIRGQDLGALSGADRDSFRADHVGFVFQMFNLIPYLSLIENVVLPCRFSPERRRRIAARGKTPGAEARRILAHLELDPDALAGRPVAELSVGQQQRVAAARALIGAPELVIADEPTSALDADTRRSFLDLLFREVADADATLIFVSHDGGLAQAFDRTVALADLNRAERSE
ncbi:MAG: ABC transporter ATP-binding protein [Alphaproteobacteria bacterium]|nr:ABC transporter ATP-binding protein [Alphaproteobacteria bacterium]